MPAISAVPCGSNSLQLHICETGLGEPINVLLLRREQHPHVGEEAGKPVGGMDGSNEAGLATLLNDAVSLLDTTLGIGPILDAEKKNEGSQRIVVESQFAFE